MIVVRARIEHDLDRDALHDLDVVSGGVFWREEAEAGAAGGGNAVDLPVIGPAVGVDFNRGLLSNFHFAKLRLFEVGRDPNVVQVDDLHEFLAGSNILPDLHRAIAHDAGDRGYDFGVLQVQLGLIKIRLLALGFGQGRRCPGLYHLNLVGRGLNQLALSLSDLLLRGVGGGAGGFDRGSTGLGSGRGLVVLLLRNFLLVDQLLVADRIVLSLYVVGFRLLQLGLGRLELLPGRLDAGASAVDVGFAGR